MYATTSRLTVAAAICLLSAFAAAQQHDMSKMTPAVTLEQGLSDLHRPVTTQNAEAQKFFDQGLRFVYAFNHEAAVASFRHAAELDTDLASAYWGAALALGPNINLDVDPDREKQAFESIQMAKTHAENASPVEKDLIDALSKRYSAAPDADLKKLAADYSAAMGALVKKYPKDDDVATLYAESLMDLHPWKFWTADGKPAEGTMEIVSTLETVLKRNPNHLGANHYYIHAVEASSDPGRALASAKRLPSLAPGAGHLVHMPAHVLQRTGDYAGAAAANSAAADTDRTWIKSHGAEGIYPLMYYNHNLQFGSNSYAMSGDYEKARAMADEMASNVAPVVKEMAMVDPILAYPLQVRLRFARWADVLAYPDNSAGPYSAAYRHFARGVAMARSGDVAGAEAEQKALTGASVSDDPGMLQNSPKALLAVAIPLLAGNIAMARGDEAAAIASFREAVAAEDKLGYNEPPDWFSPSRETLGGALLRDKQFGEAERVFREDLKRNPNNPRSLYGLSKAIAGQNKSASGMYDLFKRVWKGGKLGVEDL